MSRTLPSQVAPNGAGQVNVTLTYNGPTPTTTPPTTTPGTPPTTTAVAAPGPHNLPFTGFQTVAVLDVALLLAVSGAVLVSVANRVLGRA